MKIDMIKWLGHSGFLVYAEKRIIAIDPYMIEGTEKADIILVTHPHEDHFSLSDIKRICRPESVIISDSSTASIIGKDVSSLRPGCKVNLGAIGIEAFPAYNTRSAYHPKKKEWLGFIIDVEGTRIYHSGDTDFIPEMELLHVDVAIVPVSGTYVMSAEDAVNAISAIRPDVAIPMHYDPKKGRHWKIFPGVGVKDDALKFESGLRGVCDVVIMA